MKKMLKVLLVLMTVVSIAGCSSKTTTEKATKKTKTLSGNYQVEITVKDYIMNNNYEMVICYAIWYNKNSLIMRRDKHNEKEVDRNRCYKNTVCDTDFVFSLGRTWNRI